MNPKNKRFRLQHPHRKRHQALNAVGAAVTAHGSKIPNSGKNDMNEKKQYWAFVSYSSKDKRWGQWLHRRLENYLSNRENLEFIEKQVQKFTQILPVYKTFAQALGHILKNTADKMRLNAIVQTRLSPHLVPWDELTEEIKDYDRIFIIQMPRILKQVGYKITKL